MGFSRNGPRSCSQATSPISTADSGELKTKQNFAEALDTLHLPLTWVNIFVNHRGADQSNTADHNGFTVPSIPVLKGKFGSQNSLQASGSHGSLSDLSQTDSNPDLSSSTRKLSNQSITDQQTPRRGSAASAVSDKYDVLFCGVMVKALTPFLVSPVGCTPAFLYLKNVPPGGSFPSYQLFKLKLKLKKLRIKKVGFGCLVSCCWKATHSFVKDVQS